MRTRFDCSRAGSAHIVGASSRARSIGILSAMTTGLGLSLLLLFTTLASAGVPTFGEPVLFGSGSDYTRRVAAGDMDGDGDLDLVAAGNNKVYLNDGGNFNMRSVYSGNGSRGVAVGDLNGDGALDIAVGNSGQNWVLLNDGAGGFYTDTINCASPPTNVRCLGPGGDDTVDVAIGDLDGDGHLDVAVANSSQSYVYLNDGASNFHTGTVNCSSPPASVRCYEGGSGTISSVELADLNQDGQLDLVTAGTSTFVYLNDGTVTFSTTPPNPAGGVALGDLDGDGHVDLAIGIMGGQNTLYLNDGTGHFPASRDFGEGWSMTGDVTPGDVDGDGDLDLIVGNTGNWVGTQNAVYLNDGAGWFDATGVLDCVSPPADVRCFGTGGDFTNAVLPVDVNGDGHLDLAVGNRSEQDVVYLNDGAGRFGSRHNFGPGNDYTSSMDVGDLDGDGDLDVIVGNREPPIGHAPSVAYLNTGAASFPVTRTFGVLTQTYDVAVGDADADGDLDLAVGNDGQQNVLFLNDGSGGFFTGTVNCSSPPSNAHCYGSTSDRTRSVAFGDLDGDGDLDLAVGNRYQQNAVLLNDGLGQFYTGTLVCNSPPSNGRCVGPDGDRTNSVALGDLDQDGDLDLAVGNNGRNVVGEDNI